MERREDMSKPQHRTSILAGTAFLIVAFAAPLTAQPAPSATADKEALIAAARKEGQVVFYCSIGETSCHSLASAFEKTYSGIEVRTMRLASGDMSARFGAEKTSGAPTADLLMTSDPPFVKQGIADGILQPWTADMLPQDFPQAFVMADVKTPYTFTVNGMAYNTKLVDKDHVPKTYKDLLDPYFKGHLCNAAPSVSPSVGMLFGTAEATVGKGFLESMVAQGIRFYAGGNVAAIQAMAAGECWVMPFVNPGQVDALKVKGAPVDVAFPQAVSGIGYPYALAARSRNPNAQKLFAEWLISREGNQALLDLEPATVTPYVAPKGLDPAPPNFKYLEPDEQTRIKAALGVR
jgi:iron(III) transport system substrate-binding protein